MSTTSSPSLTRGVQRSAGVLGTTFDTCTGRLKSIPPLTLKPKRPCSSANRRIVIKSLPLSGTVEQPLI